MRTAAYHAILVTAGIGMLAAFGLVFTYAPVDARMGVVQKIFYFHVGAAYTMYLAWAVCTVASIVYLARRNEVADMVAASAGELALLFAVVVMVSGPLWGRKSWGAFWTWDPRLTATLLLTLVIFSYVLLRTLSRGEVERRFAAALAILGAAVAPIIHLSVRKWRGQHPTVITGDGGGLDPEMRTVFILGMAVFTLFFFALLHRRFRLEQGVRRLATLTEDAVAGGLDDGGRR